jgi:2'-5' RNA ligase
MHDSDLRLFFALPCPAPMAERIDAWRQTQGFAGRATARANLHLTLAFLGHLPGSQLPLLEQIPARLPLIDLAFELCLDRLDCWHGGLLHLAPRPTTCGAAGIGQRTPSAAEPGWPALRAAYYRPHLTLARDSRLPAQVRSPNFTWCAEELVLYQSEQGRYRPLAHWPLGRG